MSISSFSLEISSLITQEVLPLSFGKSYSTEISGTSQILEILRVLYEKYNCKHQKGRILERQVRI